MKIIWSLSATLSIILSGYANNGFSQLELPTYISDNMVIQQKSLLKITGKSPGKVTANVSWDKGKIYSSENDNGIFNLEIPTPEAGGPYTITITDSKGNHKTLSDIYSGEVWLCSGQSNMEMPVKGWGKVNNYQAELDTAINFPLIRLLKISKTTATSPSQNAKVNMGGWVSCSPETVENFSAIAYFFARDLQRELNGIPIGVIDCSWGGTPAEAWTSEGALKEIGDFDERLAIIDRVRADSVGKMEAYKKAITNYYNRVDSICHNWMVNNQDVPPLKIKAPGYWEKSVLPEFDGLVMYRKTVDIPHSMAGKKLTLSLAKIDDEDFTFFNGTKIGRNGNRSAFRKYTIPDSIVKEGKAVISVCVHDPSGNGGIYGDSEDMYLSDENNIISLAGDWGYEVLATKADLGKLVYNPFKYTSPTALYNAMLYPLHNISVAGVLWYQGCNNVGRAEQYSRLFPLLINDWRNLFNDHDMPFYFVQLAAYLKPKEIQPDSDWAALRAAQESALQLKNVGMATAIDIGDPIDIHPKNKQEVARRLSLIALNRNYGKDVNYIAPRPSKVKYEGNSAIITFDKKIQVKGDPTGFIVKIFSGEWIIPKTVILNDTTVTLTAESQISAIKYNWADFPNGNLYGTDNLPVTPFVM